MEEDDRLEQPSAEKDPLLITNQSVQKIEDHEMDQVDDEEDADDEHRDNNIQADQYLQQHEVNQYGEYHQPDQDLQERNDAFGQPLGIQSEEQEDLDAIIESISYGKTQQIKKLQFQAFTAAIAHED